MTAERTLYEAQLDCRFGRQFCIRNARLYHRVDFLFGFVGLFGGSAAFAGAVSVSPTLAGAAGAVLAISSILERLVQPATKAAEFRIQAQRYAKLDARSSEVTLKAFDAELRQLQADGPLGIQALVLPAHNENLLSNGHDEFVIPLGRWSKLINTFF